MRFIIFLFLLIPLAAISQYEAKPIAYNHIQNLKSGVLLVRLHTDEVIIAQMKKRQQHKLLKSKLQEIEARNKEIYMAFSSGYTFTQVYFFYGKDSEKVMAKNFSNIFIGEDLKIDTSIVLPANKPVYVVDVGDIYFEAFGGHFDGMIVMDEQIKPLEKPFPYYVRRRSGMPILKRSYLEMVLILQKEFEGFYKESSPKMEY